MVSAPNANLFLNLCPLCDALAGGSWLKRCASVAEGTTPCTFGDYN